MAKVSNGGTSENSQPALGEDVGGDETIAQYFLSPLCPHGVHLFASSHCQQLPLSSRWNVLPVKLKYWSLVLPHEHSACALVALMQIGKTPSGANPVLQH